MELATALFHLPKAPLQDAFFELVGWEKGIFRIFHGQLTDETNINMDTMNVLLEASKALDEKRYLAETK